jgi:hypothetical protein
MYIYPENHLFSNGVVVSLRLSHVLTAKSTLYANAGTEPGGVWPYLLGGRRLKRVNKIFAECFTAYLPTFVSAWKRLSVRVSRR